MSLQNRKSWNSLQTFLVSDNRGNDCYVFASSEMEAKEIYFHEFGYGLTRAFIFSAKPVDGILLEEVE